MHSSFFGFPAERGRLLRKRASEARFLKSLRRERGLTQRDLARRLGISRGQLQRLEAGPAGDYALRDLRRLAEIFSLPLEDLLFRLDPAPPRDFARASLAAPFSIKFFGGMAAAALSLPEAAVKIQRLSLPARGTLGASQVPRGDFLWCLMLEGELVLTMGGRVRRFEKGDFFQVTGRPPCEWFNPHLLHPAQVLSVSLQGFSPGDDGRNPASPF